jgi:hypothetical protein
VSQLAIDPSDPETLYVAANLAVGIPASCTAWKSTDRGKTWSCLSIGTQQVAGIFVAAARPATLYAITTPAGCCYNGLSKSTDAGLTWTNLDAPLHYFAVSGVAIDPTDPDRVFVTTAGGVFRTTDGGATWLGLDHGLPSPCLICGPFAVAIDPHVPTTLYIAGTAGVYRSTNDGLAWHPLNGGLPEDAFFLAQSNQVGVAGVLVVDPVRPGRLYAGTRHNGMTNPLRSMNIVTEAVREGLGAGHTQGPAFMIGHKAATMIRGFHSG